MSYRIKDAFILKGKSSNIVSITIFLYKSKTIFR